MKILTGIGAILAALALFTFIAMIMQVGDLPSHKTVSKVIPVPAVSSSSVVIHSSSVANVTVDADADTNEPGKLGIND